MEEFRTPPARPAPLHQPLQGQEGQREGCSPVPHPLHSKRLPSGRKQGGLGGGGPNAWSVSRPAETSLKARTVA